MIDRIYRRALSLSLVCAPLVFYWTTEMAIATGPYDANCYLFGDLTNGFFSVSGCQAYHITMYLLMIVCVIGSIVILQDGDE